MIKNKFRLLLGLIVWCNSMFAQVVVFNPANETDRTYSSDKDKQILTKDGITISLSCPNNPNTDLYGYFNDSDRYAVYANCVLTISSVNRKIVKIELINTEKTGYTLKNFKDKATDQKLQVDSEDKTAKWIGYKKEVELHNQVKASWLSEIKVTLNTFSISESNYATMWLDNSFKVPHGVKAHTVSVENGVLSYPKTFNEDDLVFAETPILLEGNEGVYEYEVVDISTQNYENMLRQSEGKRINLGTGYYLYKLSYDNSGDNVGFYWDSNDGHTINGNGITVPEGRCYLRVPVQNIPSSTTTAKGFSIDGISSEIGGVKVKETTGDKIYDISGVYVGDDSTKLKKGLYVRNGKKIVVE